MQQQIAVPQMQQVAPPPAVAERPAPPVEDDPSVQKEKNSAVLNKVEKLLSRLAPDKLQEWQTKFEDKRNEAEKNGRTNVMEYYDRLIVLCEKLKKDGEKP